MNSKDSIDDFVAETDIFLFFFYMRKCFIFATLSSMLGVFDSGVGGLTVLSAIRSVLPDLPVTYLGDSARMPYGNHERSIITQYTKECCALLFDRGCSLIVLACNTASAETLRELQQEWLPMLNRDGTQRNILGVIRPLAEGAVEALEHRLKGRHSSHKSECIGVVGTRSTTTSETYVEELKALRPEVRVIQQACPLLVPLVEEQWHTKPEARKILKTYLGHLKSHNPNVLILGCTHYEALHSQFSEMMGRRCLVLHSPTIVSSKLAAYLTRHPEYAMHGSGVMHILTTGDPVRFAQVGSQFFGSQLPEAEKVTICPSTMVS
jgi:glutamate racemase